MGSAASGGDGSGAPSPLTEEQINDAALQLQLIRARQIATWRTGRPGPFEVAVGDQQQVMATLMGWFAETRRIISIHDARGPLRGFLADQDDRDYRLVFAPVRIKLLDRVGVLMEGPVVDDNRTAMLMRDRAALTAAARYVEAVRASTWRVADADNLVALSARQRTVVNMLSGGLRDDQIAYRLGISLRTVRTDVAAVLDALEASTRFEAGFRYATLTVGG